VKAREIPLDHLNKGEIAGVLVRKGTVAAPLANARIWTGAAASTDKNAVRDILESLPAQRALGLIDLPRPRDEQLPAFLQIDYPHLKPTHRRQRQHRHAIRRTP
jgi:hypothetical protein